jgi:tRNA pseudouridine13 synthase
LYKENKDTMDAVNTIARLLKIKASNFGFAGTKDRRAATTQRISIFGQKPRDLIRMNTRIANVRVGDFAFSPNGIELGDHAGNEFVITIKNCEPLIGEDCSLLQKMKMIQQTVKCGLAYLKQHGYINYFGLQRFGTYNIGTHLLGMKILQGDLQGFIDDVLHVDQALLDIVLNTPQHSYGIDNPAMQDDLNRARAITTWRTTKRADAALEIMPKRFSAETAIIRHLGRNPNDLVGAILSITRGMRMMYIHAYQSYVWNFVATRRWAKFGSKVIEGDLVFVKEALIPTGPKADMNPYAQNDEDCKTVRPLTAEDIASGNYTIDDIVLPLPGYDVVYPANEIGDYYREFMGRPENGSLDPDNMRRQQRDFSLSGAYRYLIGHFLGEPEFAVLPYRDDTQQLWPTDLDVVTQKKLDEIAEAAPSISEKDTTEIANRWGNPIRSIAEFDKAVDAALEEQRRQAQLRRKAEGLPETNVVRTQETWIQTGVDGNFKRIKIARHRQVVENQIGDASATTDTNETINTEPTPAATGAPVPTGDQPSLPVGQLLTDGPIPVITVPKETTPAPAVRSVSETYYAQAGLAPYFGPLPSGIDTELGNTTLALPSAEQTLAPAPLTMAPTQPSLGAIEQTLAPAQQALVSTQPTSGPVSQPTQGSVSNSDPALTLDLKAYLEEHARKAEEKQAQEEAKTLLEVKEAAQPTPEVPMSHGDHMMAWILGKVDKPPKFTFNPDRKAVSTPTGPRALVDAEKAKSAAASSPYEPGNLVNGIKVPRLQRACDNPLAKEPEIDESLIGPFDNKIAVVLKFQLKVSNYATIVLRELMGTTAEELAH